MSLNPKQQAFVQEYLADLNATQAAIRAGYSSRTAHAQGHRLLRHAEIQAAITEAQQQRQRRTTVTADRVVQELARVGFGSLRDVVSWGGSSLTLRPSAELSEDQAASLAEVTEGRHGLRVRLFDKLRALEMLARHCGVYDTASAGDPHEDALALKEELRGMLELSGGPAGEACYEPEDGAPKSIAPAIR